MAFRDEYLLLQEDLVDELRCPVCVDIMHPPIIACSKGHNFCNNCDKQLSTCPYCRGAKGPKRNFVLENIHDKLVLPCKNRSKGCAFISKGDSIVQHEKVCTYKEDTESPDDSNSVNDTADNEQENTTSGMENNEPEVDPFLANIISSTHSVVDVLDPDDDSDQETLQFIADNLTTDNGNDSDSSENNENGDNSKYFILLTGDSDMVTDFVTNYFNK